MRPERRRDADIAAAYRSGAPLVSIAAEFGVSVTTVHNARKRVGEPQRGRTHLTGQRSPSWRGGRTLDEHGYVRVLMPDGSRRREHRLVMEGALGRALEAHETVHHLNGDRADNRIENLQLRSGRHGRGVAASCRACGSIDVDFTEV